MIGSTKTKGARIDSEFDTASSCELVAKCSDQHRRQMFAQTPPAVPVSISSSDSFELSANHTPLPSVL